MEATVSQRLKAVLLTARSAKQTPATGLQVVIDALATLIPEVEALEASQGAQGGTPSFSVDELRRRRDEAETAVRDVARNLKTGLREAVASVSDALDHVLDALDD